MNDAFVHYEILGPRDTLDGWLTSLQDMGSCHLADAMHGLEGETGIGRPAPSFEEMQAEMIRSEAGRALRAVARVLPASRTARGLSAAGGSAESERPDWQLGVGGGGAARLARLRDESLELAGHMRKRLDAVGAAEDEVEQLDVLAAAARSAASREVTDLATVRALALPKSTRRVRGLLRRLRRAGLDAVRADGRRSRAIVVRVDAGRSAEAGISPVAEAVGARMLGFPEDLVGLSAVDAREEARRRFDDALRRESAARAGLLASVAEHGPRARLLLDSLEDADARMTARKRLAATEHVAAARVYVRRENAAELREQLAREFGDVVVVRPLAAAGDEPTVPRQVAPVPLGALEGLKPTSFGDVPMASLLALFAPLAVGAVWADVAGGLILLVAGGLLGAAAGAGSPRRDTALLGQVAGLLALILGVLAGRAFGAAGVAWFGTGWGLAPGVMLVEQPEGSLTAPFVGMLYVLGQVALVIAAWGILLTLQSWRAERVARARARLLAALHFATVAGLAFAALPEGHGMRFLWPLAPIALVGVLALSGLRGLLFGLCLDLVGVLRLVVVGGGALLLFGHGFAALVEPTLLALCVVPPALMIGAIAVLADPAHLAMGVPYDLSLGGRQFTRPFAPLRRRVRLAGG